MDTKHTEVRDEFSSRLNLLEGRMLQSVKDELTKSSAALDTRLERLMTAVESVVASQKDITEATMVLQQVAPSVLSDSSSNESKSSATSTESTGLVKSPDSKRLKSGGTKMKKIKLKDSIRRILDDRAHKPPASNTTLVQRAPEIMLTDSDESMEHIFRQMEEIAQHTSRPDFSSNTHDPESHYTACHERIVDLSWPWTVIMSRRTGSRIQRSPSDPSVPSIPASRLLLIPSQRPGRTFRSSPIDQHPFTSYGDPIHQKVRGSLRILFQNVNVLTHSTTLEDYRYYHKCLQGLSVDIMGLSETNTCWSHHHLSSDFRLATKSSIVNQRLHLVPSIPE